MDNQKGRAVDRGVAWQVKQLYEQKMPDGRRKFSMQEIAAKLGISETTVYRAVKSLGRFANTPLPEAKPDDLIQREAEESMKRALAGEGPLGEIMRAAAAKAEEERAQSAAARMAVDARAAKERLDAGDKLLKELTDGSGTKPDTNKR